MKYQIRGSHNVRLETDDAATALGYAEATQREFPPMEIWEIRGQLTLEELRRRADQGRNPG